MAQSINGMNNLAGLNPLNKTQTALAKALEKLASGKKINSAADDAAGLAIANRFQAQINGLNTATRNAADGIAYAQTVESALDETTTALQRMRDLSLQAANGTLNGSDRAAIQAEITQLQDEVTRIADTTTFNGRRILGNSNERISFQIGPDPGSQVEVKGFDASARALGSSTTQVSGIDVTTPGGPQSALDTVDAALSQIDAYRSNIGAIQNRFESSIRNLSAVSESQSAALSRIQDTDYAAQIAEFSREQVKRQAGLALQAQANAISRQVLSLLS